MHLQTAGSERQQDAHHPPGEESGFIETGRKTRQFGEENYKHPHVTCSGV